MAYLPLANIMHHKLRSTLSALGIGIGICMLVTLSGLARGSVYEIADRWESVDADLTVCAKGTRENAGLARGVGLSDGVGRVILGEHGDIVERVVPVFLWPMKMAGQDQTVAGVDPHQWKTLTAGRGVIDGRPFDPHGTFTVWIKDKLLGGPGRAGSPDQNPKLPDGKGEVDLSADLLAARGGLELVIDTRLARAGGYAIDQKVVMHEHTWTIVGIVEAGAMTRVFMPRRTAAYLFGSQNIRHCTLIFVKLKPGVTIGPAARKIARTTNRDVLPLNAQRQMLLDKFGVMFLYVDAVNVIALVIAFLFVMITLYTMVLQQTREIAILKANGAGNWFILRQVLGESMILTAMGAATGIALSPLAAWAIETVKPLLTVTITPKWVVIAIGASFAGAVVSAVYPAWRATRVDIVTALTLE